jgi:protein TonB
MAAAPDRGRKLLRTSAAVLGLLLLVSLGWYVHGLIGEKSPQEKRSVPVVIKIIRPPEPPPEPPPPPPEKVQETVPQDTPEQKPVEQAPQSAQLGIDAEGGAGGDSFGLVGNAGGRDLVGSGSGPFVFYASAVKDLVLDTLTNIDRIKRSKYNVEVRVWIASDGRVERASLGQSTGSKDLDTAIEQALAHAGRVGEPPPIEMPQPITFRIVSRG